MKQAVRSSLTHNDELTWQYRREEAITFTPEDINEPKFYHRWAYLIQMLSTKSNSVNQFPGSLKRCFAWLVTIGQLKYKSTKVAKLIGVEYAT